MAVALPIGRIQVWFREGMRDVTYLERCCILPVWGVFRLLFIITFRFALLIYWVGYKLGRLSAD